MSNKEPQQVTDPSQKVKIALFFIAFAAAAFFAGRVESVLTQIADNTAQCATYPHARVEAR